MREVYLADDLYREAQRLAMESGFTSVDEYVADVIVRDLQFHAENQNHLFTPQVIRELDRISAAAKEGGKTYSPEEVREHFRKKGGTFDNL